MSRFQNVIMTPVILRRRYILLASSIRILQHVAISGIKNPVIITLPVSPRPSSSLKSRSFVPTRRRETAAFLVNPPSQPQLYQYPPQAGSRPNFRKSPLPL
ncbi:hypothetical protein M378DRAFT_168947, partial [Amanita muscaria Koide BX008]